MARLLDPADHLMTAASVLYLRTQFDQLGERLNTYLAGVEATDKDQSITTADASGMLADLDDLAHALNELHCAISSRSIRTP